MKNDILNNKTYSFSLRIIKLYKYLKKEHNEFILSKQIIRSGTAIGALVRESKFAQSKADFISKLSISLKEANETLYWLELLQDSDFITKKMFDSLKVDLDEIISILVSSIKTLKGLKKN
jgi:four helix bundle protein